MEMQDTVDSVITKNFELQESRLTAEQATQYLVEIIKALPVQGLKVIALVGGPASGKSTLVKSLIDALAKLGLKADSISTDDYAVGTRAWRWEREREDPLRLKDFAL